jgi:hypothetical protein
MQTLIDATGRVLGVFSVIEVQEDRLHCSGMDMPFTVIGDGWSVIDGNEPPTLAHTWDGAQWVAPPAPPLDRAAMVAQIDAAAKAVYERFLPFAEEYKAREAQAQAYKDAGYTGTVPPRVAGFATPAGLTPEAATDLILSQAANLRGALNQLSDLRMQKYLVSRAATDAESLVASNETMAAISAVDAALS